MAEAAKPCLFCHKPLSWRKRSDAVFCSPRHRQAAHRAIRADPVVVWRHIDHSFWPGRVFVSEYTEVPRPCAACGLFVRRMRRLFEPNADRADEAAGRLYCSLDCAQLDEAHNPARNA
jgi:endogenous inhibitor of DNA gyrase (YacG/DUF329 family)